ncbi:glycosyltransferase family 2 protein [Terrisporobacter sp.]
MSKLVSIIVAIYNVDQYLNKCIESILSQTYENLEIILINDGSEDNSKLICEKYLAVDDRIILINKTNGGVSSARNRGIDTAKGDYITFIDGDDYICKESIETMVKCIEQFNVDMSVCGYRIFSEEHNVSKISDDSETNTIMSSKDILTEIFKNNKVNGFLWNKMFRRDIFNSIRLPEDMDICEDLYIVCKILRNDLNIYYTSKSLYNYRESVNSVTKNIDKLLLKDGTIKYVDAFNKISELLNNDKDIVKLIRIRKVKVIMETYYLMIKNKYKNKLATTKIYEELHKEKKYYLQNKNIPTKLKVAFTLFIFKLYMENLFTNRSIYE